MSHLLNGLLEAEELPMRADVDAILASWAAARGVKLADVRRLAHWLYDLGYDDARADLRE